MGESKAAFESACETLMCEPFNSSGTIFLDDFYHCCSHTVQVLLTFEALGASVCARSSSDIELIVNWNMNGININTNI